MTREEEFLKSLQEKDFAQLKEILLEGVDVRGIESSGRSLLKEAGFRGHDEIEVFELLIKNGANVNWSRRSDDFEDGMPLLSFIARGGNARMVELLLDNGADGINRDDNVNHYTPLINAILWQQPDVVEVLLKRGADPKKPALGLTPLKYAKRAQNTRDGAANRQRIIELLKEAISP